MRYRKLANLLDIGKVQFYASELLPPSENRGKQPPSGLQITTFTLYDGNN